MFVLFAQLYVSHGRDVDDHTIFSLKLCFLHTEIIDGSLPFLRFRPVFTHLVLQSATHLFQVCLKTIAIIIVFIYRGAHNFFSELL